MRLEHSEDRRGENKLQYLIFMFLTSQLFSTVINYDYIIIN